MEPDHRLEDGPLRIVLVEDNPGDAELVQLSLAEFPGEVRAVRRAERLADALAELRREPVDVALLDLSLPDATGLEALERLRAEHPELPIVVLTGAVGDVGARALRRGAQDFLIKGEADGPLLLRSLRYAVERLRIERRARLLLRERAAREGAERAERRARLLAEISRTFGASLDFDAALEQATRLVIPAFADGVVVERDAGDGDGERRWTVAHADRAEGAIWVAVLEGLRREGALAGLAPLVAAGQVAVLAALAPAELARLVGDGRVPPGLPACRLGAFLLVPLAAHGRLHGAIAFLAADPDRRFGSVADRILGEEIGARAGAALENARLYREARGAIAARDEFLSVASHELRTPLTALQLRLQTIRRRGPGADDRLARTLEIADRQVRRLDRLITSLLDVSRITTGRIRLEPEPLDLAQIAAGTVERLAEEATAHGTPVEFRAEGNTAGSFDRLALERVLSNLLSNAFKYGAGRPVTLSIAGDGDGVTVVCQDRGIGIEAEDQERIFARFERAVSSRHFGGLGLGLYITRKLVEAHGGTIALESRPGAGSRFTVRLPRDPGPVSRRPAPESESASAGL